MKPVVVAFTGFKQHGKDTAAGVLLDHYGFVRVSFADGLRETIATALRVSPEYFLDPRSKEEVDPRTGVSPRQWLQFIGTEGFRKLWEDVWVEWWRAEILEACLNRVVVTDLRFPNELAVVQSSDFYSMTARIHDPRRPEPTDPHESEAHIRTLAVDEVILNDGSIEDLHRKVEKFLRKTRYI